MLPPGPGSLILPTQISEARVSVGQAFILNFPGMSPKLTVWLRKQEMPVPQSWLPLPATCSPLSFSSTFRFRDATGLRNQTHLDSKSTSGLGLSARILSPRTWTAYWYPSQGVWSVFIATVL